MGGQGGSATDIRSPPSLTSTVESPPSVGGINNASAVHHNYQRSTSMFPSSASYRSPQMPSSLSATSNLTNSSNINTPPSNNLIVRNSSMPPSEAVHATAKMVTNNMESKIDGNSHANGNKQRAKAKVERAYTEIESIPVPKILNGDRAVHSTSGSSEEEDDSSSATSTTSGASSDDDEYDDDECAKIDFADEQGGLDDDSKYHQPRMCQYCHLNCCSSKIVVT